MTDLRQAAQLALEALDELNYCNSSHAADDIYYKAIAAINEPLAEQPAEQEPVAWMHTNAVGHTYFRKHEQGPEFNPVPLYTAPQPRREVELTDEEIYRALDAANVPELPAGYKSVELEIARAVINAYKTKQGEKT